MKYRSTKKYGHEVGLSCCFRQWRAESHCKLLHGYSIAVMLEFSAKNLDERNWVVDFGSLKSFKGWLEQTFDHTLLVAEDDPELQTFLNLDRIGVAKTVVVPACGCEKFAEMVFECAEVWLKDNGYSPRVSVSKVEIMEHGANSAIFTKES